LDLKRKILENRFVRLEPLAEAHREGLRAACAADPTTWNELYPFSMLDEHFEPIWTRLMTGDMAASAVSQAYAVVVDGKVGGMTSYLGIDLINARVEVGATFYRPDLRGGAVNPSAKRLMLGHAFDSGIRRLQLCVDAINLRSRAAVLKLGAVQEGILRQDRVTWTGRVRDTVHFSILADEWPAVRDRLDARLAALTA
jgi:N-acetyltransferase